MQPWALVSPASRGIGLQLARHLLQNTNLPIVTTARTDLDHAKESILDGLQNIDQSRLSVLKLDVLDESTIQDAASACSDLFPKKDNYLHISYAVPGILFPEKSPQQIDHDDALLTFRTNTLGPMMMLKHFGPFLPRKSTQLAQDVSLPKTAVWATMSARVGSITDNQLGGWYSYRASKAAVNQVTKTFDNHLRTASGEKAIAISLHPGTVKTSFSKEFWGGVKEGKLFSPEFSAEKLYEVVVGRTIEDRGKCWDWKGTEVPP
ncbi:NAD(P)-binding protein [Aureobasidium sp. EXF-8845]|nr:NAD(P)-binding protein [Aureobasidium sp. EXF-8845]KAI4843743.1 NAD(P)-binding protein [Aureobasidium sp. EXF-8846]